MARWCEVTMAVRDEAPARGRFRYTLPGAWVALVFACLAITPSLLPPRRPAPGWWCAASAPPSATASGWPGRGRDVLGAMTWIPLVIFWQVTVDLPLAAGVPAGHGHTYTREFADGWDAVLQTDLPDDKLERLRDIVTAPV